MSSQDTSSYEQERRGKLQKLRDLGVKVWVLPSPTQRVSFADFRTKCVEEKISGVYIEGGAHLVSELLTLRELDYMFIYRAPILLADEKAKSGWLGLREDKLDQAVRLADVRHGQFCDDQLMRGQVVYPAKLHLDEAAFNLSNGN